jgi:hypothetical protein
MATEWTKQELQEALAQVDKRYDSCRGGYRDIAAAILCQRKCALAALKAVQGLMKDADTSHMEPGAGARFAAIKWQVNVAIAACGKGDA